MKQRTKGIIALLFLSVIWASFGIPIRYLSPHFTVYQQLYIRIFLGGIFGTIVFNKDIHFDKLFKLPKKDLFALSFRILSMYGFALGLYTQAYTLTTFGNVSFLGAIPTTAVLGFILLREKVTLQKILLILLAVVGILFITVKDPSHFWSWGRGDVFALIADFFFSLSYIGRKWQTNFLSNKELAVFMLYFGSSLLFLLSMITGEGLPQPSQFSPFIISVIVAASVLNVASLFLLNYGFAYVEAALASNIVSLESFWAVFLGFLFFKEIPTIQSFIGGLLIIASVVFLNREEEKK